MFVKLKSRICQDIEKADLAEMIDGKTQIDKCLIEENNID